MSYFTPLKPRLKLTLLYDCLTIYFNENGRNKKPIINQHRVILDVNWIWFQIAHLNKSFSLYSCHKNICILISITSWHWSCRIIWCLFYLNQKKTACWESGSLCPLFLPLNTYRYAHFTLWITSSAVWLCDKQANCHGNPASLALLEVADRTLPLSSQIWHVKAQTNVPFPFQEIISPLWGHL